ncbi:MAG: sensor histidine kinase [Brachymonas sp.]|nr:sensor histidine kinase [Brachymonas sp.]
MLTPLLIVWPLSLVLTWWVAQGIADKPFDRRLEDNLLVLSQLAVAQGNKAVFNLPTSASQILRADDDDLVYYQVLGLRGEYLSGDRDVPLPEDDRPSLSSIRIRDDVVRGLDVRVAWTYVALAGKDLPSNAKPLLIQVAETREKRSRLATEIVKGVLLPQFVLVPLVVFLVWLALARGIQPLSQLQERIRKRRADDLSPIDTMEVPLEVSPLVQSVNDLFARERSALVSQKRFLADAAHQLKTPLAGLRMQAELALRSGSSESDIKQSLQQISRSSMRATRTVNQLLALARAENEGRSLPMQSINLASIATEVVRDALPRAMERGIDLGYEGPDAGTAAAQLQGSAALLPELVRNLVDNALNYVPSTPEHKGIVTVRLLAFEHSEYLEVQVEDNGPGIPKAERELVLQPFYRSLGQSADGSGLGLAIVQEITKRHQAELLIEETSLHTQWPGVRLIVRFPRQLAGKYLVPSVQLKHIVWRI